jgi:hypothetical protein
MALTLTNVFADLPDPGAETANKLHALTDILTIATCAVIAGAEGWEDIAQYGRSKEPFFRQFLELRNGIPSHDTFYRVFARLDPDAFADRFARWMAEVGRATGLTRPDIDGPTHIAVDGKSARRSEKATFAGCQTETLDLIRRRGGEYVVCVKGNQPGLRDAIADVFDRAAESRSPRATGTRR